MVTLSICGRLMSYLCCLYRLITSHTQSHNWLTRHPCSTSIDLYFRVRFRPWCQWVSHLTGSYTLTLASNPTTLGMLRKSVLILWLLIMRMSWGKRKCASLKLGMLVCFPEARYVGYYVVLIANVSWNFAIFVAIHIERFRERSFQYSNDVLTLVDISTCISYLRQNTPLL